MRQNLKDSGVAEVAVALRADSSSRAKAQEAGFSGYGMWPKPQHGPMS